MLLPFPDSGFTPTLFLLQRWESRDLSALKGSWKNAGHPCPLLHLRQSLLLACDDVTQYQHKNCTFPGAAVMTSQSENNYVFKSLSSPHRGWNHKAEPRDMHVVAMKKRKRPRLSKRIELMAQAIQSWLLKSCWGTDSRIWTTSPKKMRSIWRSHCKVSPSHGTLTRAKPVKY